MRNNEVKLELQTAPRVWEILAIFGVALAVRLIHLDHTPMWDELYHMLAAQSWSTDGTLAIADGEYKRASWYTKLVSLFIYGPYDPLVGGRIPSVLFGSALVTLLFYWTSAVAGRAAGWMVAMMLCFAALSINLSQIVRFYSLHAACFALGAYAIFRAIHVERSQTGRLAYALLAGAALCLAFSVQLTTLIGLAGLGLYGALLFARRWGPSLLGSPHGLVLTAGLLLVGGAGLLVVLSTGVLDEYWAHYRRAPFWGANNVDNIRYYAGWLNHQYSILLKLFPIAVGVAIWRHRTFSLFCLTIFTVAFLLHSFGASKHPRYFFYVMPFFFAIWGIALAELGSWVVVILRRRLPGRDGGSGARLTTALVITCIMILFLAPNQAYQTGVLMMVRPDSEWRVKHPYRGFPDWAAASDTLKPMAEQADVFLTSSGVKSLYYLGRLDYDVSVTLRYETKTKAEFGIDPRTGRPVISEPTSLKKLMKKHRSGLVVIDARRWRSKNSVTDAVADYLEAHTERIDVPKEWKLLVFRWNSDPSRVRASPPIEPMKDFPTFNSSIRVVPH